MIPGIIEAWLYADPARWALLWMIGIGIVCLIRSMKFLK